MTSSLLFLLFLYVKTYECRTVPQVQRQDIL